MTEEELQRLRKAPLDTLMKKYYMHVLGLTETRKSLQEIEKMYIDHLKGLINE